MRDTLVQYAQKKQEEEKKQELKKQLEELKDILLYNIMNEYIKNINFSHFEPNQKIILIDKSIHQLEEMKKLEKDFDFYYYYILPKYEAIGNKAKKYALNSPEYIKKHDQNLKDFLNDFDLKCDILLSDTIQKQKAETKKGFFWWMVSWIFK